MRQTLLLFLLVLRLSISAQITLEQDLPYPSAKFGTTDLGEKYISSYGIQETVIIYNNDWSIYNQTILPNGQYYLNFYGNAYEIPSASDKLFNGDSLIEFITGQFISPPNTSGYILRIVNELGQIQYTFPDTAISLRLYKIGTEFKLAYTYKCGVNNNTCYKVYALPGSLPCEQCNFPTGLVEQNSSGQLGQLHAYPNPFNNTLVLEYSLLSNENARLQLTGVDGRELKNLTLNNSSDKIILSTSDLPKGVVIATLYGKDERVISKKLLKIE